MTYPTRSAGLTIVAFFLVVSCSANPADGPGPQIISLETNVARLTTEETVRFVAMVADPTGLAPPIGGDLSSPDGAIKYGDFQADEEGSYSLELTWDQLQQAKSIDFAAEEQRSFVAQFYNLKGAKTTQSVTLQLHCMGLGSWSGRCLAEGSSCAPSKVFVKGACSPGCYVGGTLQIPNMINSSNVCQSCQPAASLSSWSSRPDATACENGSFCYAGSCAVKFRSQPNPGSGSLSSVWGSSATEVFAVGARILHTTNGGTTWTEQTNPTMSNLHSVWGFRGLVFAVGGNGTILRNAGGATWDPLDSTTASTLFGVWGSGFDVFAVGYDGSAQTGIILHTSSSGVTWNVQARVTFALTGVWGSSTSDVFAVGSGLFNGGGGGVLHTSNGGTTWTLQTVPPATKRLLAVWGSSATNLFAVGEEGTIIHTSDGGTTWTKQTSTTTVSLTGVWGSSATEVFAVGTNGTLLRTSDGGTTWTKQFNPSTIGLNGVWGSSSTNVFAVGLSGTALNPLILNNR